jgi:hypothetical protein
MCRRKRRGAIMDTMSSRVGKAKRAHLERAVLSTSQEVYRHAALSSFQNRWWSLLLHCDSRRPIEWSPGPTGRSIAAFLYVDPKALSVRNDCNLYLARPSPHCLGIPLGDCDYPLRWSVLKAGFSRGLEEAAPRAPSKIAKRERGLWQRRYWEHAIRDDADLERHVDYVHFNPVKHGYVTQVRDWPFSSFHLYVERGILSADWGGDMRAFPGEFGE